MCAYLQVTFQNSLGLGMHRSDRMPAISQGLFIDVPHRCDQALYGLRLVWFQTFHRWAKPNGSFELDACDFQSVFHVSLSMVSKLSDDYNLSQSSYGATGHRRRSFGRLLPQLGHVLGGKLRSFAAEARGDVVGHGRNLGIGVGVAERRHRDGILWRMSLGPGNHDLRDVRCTGIVDCPGAG